MEATEVTASQRLIAAVLVVFLAVSHTVWAWSPYALPGNSTLSPAHHELITQIPGEGQTLEEFCDHCCHVGHHATALLWSKQDAHEVLFDGIRLPRMHSYRSIVLSPPTPPPKLGSRLC